MRGVFSCASIRTLDRQSQQQTARRPSANAYVSDTDLAETIIKLHCNLSVAKEAKDAANRRYASAARDKLRIMPCGPHHRCDAPNCPYCQRRQHLIEMIEEGRVTPRKGTADRKTKGYLALSDATDDDLADEFLNVMFGIPTRKEVVRRAKNVAAMARRMGLNVGKECSVSRPCGRLNCHACRRTNQLGLIKAFLAVGDLTKVWRTISIVPSYGRSELSKQPLGDLRKVIKRIIASLLEIARLHRELGASMVYVTHDQIEAMTLADKIVVLRDGKVEQVGAPMELYNNPDNQFVAGFLGAPGMNFIPGAAAGEPDVATIGLRPEHLALDDTGTLAGTVAHVEQLGGDTNAFIDIGTGKLLTLRLFGQHPIALDANVKLRADPAHIYRFDKNGARLR